MILREHYVSQIRSFYESDLVKIITGIRRCGKSVILRQVMAEIFGDMPDEYAVEELEEREIRWECDCSRERIEDALMAIGEKDLKEIIEEDGQAELQCHFCLKKYQFNREELEQILDRMKQ